MNRNFYQRASSFNKKIIVAGTILISALLFSTCTSCSTTDVKFIPRSNIAKPIIVKPNVAKHNNQKDTAEESLNVPLPDDIKVTRFEYNNQAFIIVEYKNSWQLEKL
jgi:hypothetical protein